MRLALLTDAWHPQVNGVVRTWNRVVEELVSAGAGVEVIHPGLFRTFPAPRYPEIRLAFWPGPGVRERLDAFEPTHVHVATEGPVGLAGRRACLRRGWRFTSSYHTKYPQYLRAYFGIPRPFTLAFVRRFHNAAQATLCPTPSVVDELAAEGLTGLRPWSRGVDTAVFHPGAGPAPASMAALEKPVFLCVGRVAKEKNLAAFLDLDLPGSKVVVGDGPARRALARKHPGVLFTGVQKGDALARHYAAADAFVFPSLTDTYGVVMLEANAAGLPVAAFPVTGPIDVVVDGVTGCLNQDLRAACLDALELDPADARAHAEANSWARCAQIVRETLVPIRGPSA
ncbi:glycosyltransferase family 4 protein [Phycisphaera mikurensis]|uniref:Putative glycosyltransferase n=1 Tax=Phycisphaera mikurensis (strain NBRC 102666 / KCTC 22515 / FYK2301M01) TaxID=1142394 RepID=I0IG53_PHYMF|nr:glycosyltransferase family 1 protein [Phycisphaera mikurensis]MBB6440376.1 glycosyltransferase involved in cell wall biosynthesis [Phycisphaera mikurensis]BAM04241.1 putative glycosyltransferase [Phycisphaera mikurensis NBRC 102666]